MLRAEGAGRGTGLDKNLANGSMEVWTGHDNVLDTICQVFEKTVPLYKR